MEYPKTLVIFGITGNLAQIKLVPALLAMQKKGDLEGIKLVGIGRRDDFEIDPSLADQFVFIKGDMTEEAVYRQLQAEVTQDKIFYLATYPDLYQTIFTNLGTSGLVKRGDPKSRIVIEKPLGIDLPSAIELDKVLNRYFEEIQIYRLDHYLGKQTVQNILTFRFENTLFEPMFSSQYVDHIQVTTAEDFGIGQRGGYYDKVGAMKDVGQNHVLQMIAIATMEKNDKSERIKILKNLVAEPDKLVLGQYEGYKDEPKVRNDSDTDTFFAFRTHIKTGRLASVPIYVRGGKKLATNETKISIVFKKNVLTFRIQPNESINISFWVNDQEASMNFDYSDLGQVIPGAYETLLGHALDGEQYFFNSSQEVEAQWKFVDELISDNPLVVEYKQGSWGPKEAEELITVDGRIWL